MDFEAENGSMCTWNIHLRKKTSKNSILAPVAGHVPEITRHKFEMFLDAEDYKPEVITVETIDDLLIVRREKEKCSQTKVPEHFERYFRFERHFPLEDVYSVILEDGVLKIQTILASEEKMRHLDQFEAMDNANNE